MAVETTMVRLESDERVGFYESDHGHQVEIPQTQLDRWREVMSLFDVVQEEMQAAYDAARARHAERERIRRAEAEVAFAEARLAHARWQVEHRPDDPESWPYVGDGDTPCVGPRHPDEKDARAERMRLHNAWPGIRFDIKPYVCVDGHHHLGRSS